MRYYVKSQNQSVAKNSNKFLKFNLISEDGVPVSAVCFSEDSSVISGCVIESSLDPKSQFPKVEPDEIYSAIPLKNLDPIPEEFQKYVVSVPTKEEFVGIVSEILGLSGKGATKVASAILERVEVVLYPLYSVRTAAKAMHHAYPGGLAQHTFEMLKVLKALLKENAIPFKVNALFCLIGVLYHDYGKTLEYDEDLNYTEYMVLTPHSYLGARAVEEHFSKYLKPESLRRVQHIILSHHGRTEWGAACIPATVEALLVHLVDMMSGQGFAMKACANMEKCWFTGSYVVNS